MSIRVQHQSVHTFLAIFLGSLALIPSVASAQSCECDSFDAAVDINSSSTSDTGLEVTVAGGTAAISGINTTTGSYQHGVFGRSYGSNGIGLYGIGSGTSGYGAYGVATGTSGTGLYAGATSTSGTTYGVYAIDASSSGRAIYARNTSSSSMRRPCQEGARVSRGRVAALPPPLVPNRGFLSRSTAVIAERRTHQSHFHTRSE